MEAFGREATLIRAASAGHSSRRPRLRSTRRGRRHAAPVARAGTSPRPLAAVWAQFRLPTRIALIALTLVAIGGVAVLAKAQFSSALQQIRLYRDSLYRYKIGSPGPGAIAPNLQLRSMTGRSFNLIGYRGKQAVLLVFQHRLNRSQVSALHKDAARFRAVGIGRVVSVVAGPVDDVGLKGSTLSSSVLVDPGGRLSSLYSTGTASQTFVLVAKDGRIAWRADYEQRGAAAPTIPTNVVFDQLKAKQQSRTARR